MFYYAFSRNGIWFQVRRAKGSELGELILDFLHSADSANRAAHMLNCKQATQSLRPTLT